MKRLDRRRHVFFSSAPQPRLRALVVPEYDAYATGAYSSIWFGIKVWLERAPRVRSPVRLVLAIDRNVGELELRAARCAAHDAIETAEAHDEVGLVLFDEEVDVAAAPCPATPEQRTALHAILASTRPGHGKSLAAAMRQAQRLAGGTERVGHVLLLTDARLPIEGSLCAPLEVIQTISWGTTDATLSVIGFGDDVDVPLARWMAAAGLGRFVGHAGIYDFVGEDIGEELERCASATTSRLELVVQVRDGVVRDHGGVAFDDLIVGPSICGDQSVVIPMRIELERDVTLGNQEIGLVTVRMRDPSGREHVAEAMIEIMADMRRGRVEPEVVRARLQHDAVRAMQNQVEAGHDSAALELARAVAAMEARAECAGLSADAGARAAIVSAARARDDYRGDI
jgi:hypothetical protein